MTPRRVTGRFFVEDRSFPSAGAALSYAQNLASAWKHEARSFYVRDPLNVGLFRVDYDEDRIVRTYTLAA